MPKAAYFQQANGDRVKVDLDRVKAMLFTDQVEKVLENKDVIVVRQPSKGRIPATQPVKERPLKWGGNTRAFSREGMFGAHVIGQGRRAS